jgi:DNA-binding MarR family transcriptional regulator
MRDQTLFRLGEVDDLLLTRSEGRATASKLRKRMLTAADLVLDFSGVRAATPSFLDEICSEIDVGLRRHRDDGMLVVATHMRPEVVESFLYVLERHRHSLAYVTGNDLELLNASPQLIETLRAAVELGGEFTVPQLAERLALQPSTVNQRLADLLESGAVGRERDYNAERGRRYRYRTPSVRRRTPSVA